MRADVRYPFGCGDTIANSFQTEQEQDCESSFGMFPRTAIVKLVQVVGETEQPIDRESAKEVKASLVAQKMLDEVSHSQPALDPNKPGFKFELPKRMAPIAVAVIDLLSPYKFDRHIRKEKGDLSKYLKKDVFLSPSLFSFGVRSTRYRPIALNSKATNSFQ